MIVSREKQVHVAGYAAAAGAILCLMIVSYLLYFNSVPSLQKAGGQLLEWLIQPAVAGTLPGIMDYMVLSALLGFDFLLGLSVVLTILPKALQRENPMLVLASAMLVGLGMLGILTMISVQFDNLTRESILIAGAMIIAASNYVNYVLHRATVVSFAGTIINLRHSPRKKSRLSIKPAIIAVVVGMYAIIFFQATSFPVTEWDSLVYHANVARIWYENAPSYKVIAGPSVGIEMSYSYPPLFPAIGAGHYILAGEFNDLYLRAIAPVISLLTLAMTYLISRRYLKSIPAASVLALLSMPFFIMYSIWPTNYSTLMAFTTASILFLILALEKGSTSMRYSALAGLFIGMAMLSSYLGIILAVFSAAVVLSKIIYTAIVISRRKTAGNKGESTAADLKKIALPLFLTLISVSAIWYIFSLVTVGDPLFPFGGRFFDSEYIDEAVLEKSIEQIKQNALGYWGQYSGFELFQKQIYSIFFDPHLYSLSLLPAIAGFILAIVRRNVPMIILGAWISIVVTSQLVQGWFWLRTLTLILPPAAILSAYAIDALIVKARERNLRFNAAILQVPVYALLFIAIIYPGFIIAAVGINHPTIIYGIPSQMPYDFMQSWDRIGDKDAILSQTFLGEAAAWSWMNDNIPQNSKVATLDAREYHVRSDIFFYLDGREAAPLLDMDEPAKIREFLIDNGIRYIWAPGSTFRTSAAYPIINDLPLFKYLGTRDFPIEQIYDAWVPPSIVYDIYPSTETSQAVTTFLTGTTRQGEYEIVEAGNVRGGLVFAHTPEAGIYQIKLLYKDSGTGNVDFNLEKNNSWQIGHSILTRSDSKDIMSHMFHIDAKANGISTIGIYSYHEDFEMKQVTVSKIDQSVPSTDFSGVVVGKADGSMSSPIANAYQEQTRLFINTPDSNLYKVTIIYEDFGTGNVDFNLQQEDDSWQIGYSTLKRHNSGDTGVHTFYIDGRPDSVIPIGIFAYDENLTIQKVDIQPATSSKPSIQPSGITIQDEFNIVRSGDTDARLLINAPPENEIYQVTITYLDQGISPIDLNIQKSSDTWSTISSITRENSGETKIHTLYISGSNSSAVVLGLYAYDNDFYFKDAKIRVSDTAVHEYTQDTTKPISIGSIDDTDINKVVPEVTTGPLESPIGGNGSSADATEDAELIDIIDALSSGTSYTVRQGDTNNRLFFRISEDGIYRVAIVYNDNKGSVDFNLQNEDGTWEGAYSTITQGNRNITQTHDFYVAASAKSNITLGIYSYESDFVITSVKADKIEEFQIDTPKRGIYKVDIIYNDTGIASLDFIGMDGGAKLTSTVSKTDSNLSKHHVIYMYSELPSATLGVYPLEESDNIVIQSARIDSESPDAALSGVAVQDELQIVKADDTSVRLAISTPDDGLYNISIAYNDTGTGPVDFNLLNEDGTWQIGYSTISRTGTGISKLHTLQIIGRPDSIVSLGIYSYGSDLEISKLNASRVNDSMPSVSISGLLAEGGYYTVKAGDINSRLLVNTPDAKLYRLTIMYDDSDFRKYDRVDLNIQNEDGTWDGLKRRDGDSPLQSRAYIWYFFEGRMDTTITLGIFSPEKDLRIAKIMIE